MTSQQPSRIVTLPTPYEPPESEKGTHRASNLLFELSDHPSETVVEPRSFRNKLISVLTCTAVIPLCVLGIFQLQQVRSATDALNSSQLALAQNIAANLSDNLERTSAGLRLAFFSQPPAEIPDKDALHNTVNQLFAVMPHLERLEVFDADGILVTSHNRSPDTVAPQGAAPMQMPSNSTAQDWTVRRINSLIELTVLDHSTVGASPRAVRAYLPLAFLRITDTPALNLSDYDVALYDAGHQLFFSTEVASGRTDRRAIEPVIAPEDLEKLRASSSQIVLRSYAPRTQMQIRAYANVAPTDWTVLVSQPQARRDAFLFASMETSGVLLLFAVFMTMVVAVWMASPLTRAFNRLTEAVEKFGRTGRVDPVVRDLEQEGSSEMVELGKTFERMANSVRSAQSKLRELNATLEESVRQRTATLVSRNRELRALQQLLSPIDASRETLDIIEQSLQQFRTLLNLPGLVFVDTTSEESNAARQGLAREHLPGRSVRVPVELLGTVFGTLEVPEGIPITPDKRDSLQRLANSIAIVLTNEHLVRQLAKEHATLNTVFESMTDGVLIIGRTGRILYANDLACLLLNDGKNLRGCPSAAILEKNWHVARGDAERLQEAQSLPVRLSKQIAPGSTQTIDILTFTVENLPGYAGRRTGWLVCDVSREADIDAMKDNLISVVAHELKTPLTSLRLQAEALAREFSAGRTTHPEGIDMLLDDVERLGGLIDDLLDVSRIRSGTMSIDPRPVQIASIIDRAARLTRSRYPIQIKRTVAPKAEMINADAKRLTQVFINLFNNAARYRKPDQSEALCEVQVKADDEGIVITITDYGRGMDAKVMKHIFEPLYQGNMTTRRANGGTGLGLYIVHGIVAAHGGTISVSSKPAESSTFTIRLFFTPAAADAHAAIES